MDKREEVAIITGASAGIGNSCAMYIAKRGYKVYAALKNPEKYKKKADEFFESLKLDPGDGNSIQLALGNVFNREGRIDALILSGGVCLTGSVEETSESEAALQMESIFNNSYRVAKAALPYMRKQGSGKIIFLSGMGGLSGIPYHALHSAGRFAVKGFAESLRLELLPFGIHVSIIEIHGFRIGMEYSGTTVEAAAVKSPYKYFSKKVVDEIIKEDLDGLENANIAKCVLKIFGTRSPKFRYFPGKSIKSIVNRLKHPIGTWNRERMLLKFYSE